MIDPVQNILAEIEQNTKELTRRPVWGTDSFLLLDKIRENVEGLRRGHEGHGLEIRWLTIIEVILLGLILWRVW